MFGESKKPSDHDSVFLHRISLLAVLWLCFLGLLVARIFYLTVVRGQDLFYLSEQNFLRQIKIPAPRGKILDRQGRILATSEPRFELIMSPYKTILPEQMSQTYREIGRLCPDLKLPARNDLTKLKPGTQKTIASNLTLHSAIPLLERQAMLPGLQIEQNLVRIYPLGRTTAHLTGFSRKISSQTMKSYLQKGYDRDDIVGAAGLEKSQQDYLRGSNGIEVEHRDAMGRLLGAPMIQRSAVPGADIVLTIDANLQSTATLLLEGKSGAIVAIDPRNGDVIALASNPGYDANRPALVAGTSDSHFNHAVQDHYAPGSTFKLVTALAAMQAGISPERTIYCAGRLAVAPGLTLKCNVSWGHGAVNMRQALMVSCNTYFYQLAKDLRQENLYNAARMLGYGQPTEIPIVTNAESRGVLIPPDARSAKFLGNRVMMGIGQGELISVTPLQQAMAYAAVANGGTLFAPRIIDRIRLADGRTLLSPPVQRGNIAWNDAQRQALLDGFRMVVEQPRGTAHKVRFPSEWRVAGKTGTAQRHDPPDAWFIGFAPWDNPEICVAVLIERSGHGGEIAGPVARKFLEAYFEQKKGSAPSLYAQRAEAPNQAGVNVFNSQ